MKKQALSVRPIYSGEYIPDRAFISDLKRLDQRLGCKYRVDLNRFVITWEMPIGPCAELLVVRSETGGFRQPDNRELTMLCEGDLHRTDLKTRLQKTEKYMRDYRERLEAHERDELRQQTKDDKIQLMQTYRDVFNIGTKKSAHRRIAQRPKGKTYKARNELEACIAQ